MKPLVLVDLDRTLFDVVEFWNDFSRVFADVTHSDELSIVESYGYFSKNNNKLRYIDYDGIVYRYQLDHEEIFKRLLELSKNKSYIYNDGHRIIELLNQSLNKLDWAILTFGQESFQAMKLATVNDLKNTKQYITQIAKNDFISNYFPDRTGVLVDDKLGQDLPKGWIEVNIDRQSNQPKPKKLARDIYKIFSLDQIEDLFKNQIHLL